MSPETRSDMFNPRTGEPGIIDLFEGHVEQYIGKIETIYHEKDSDFMHVDVHVIPPDEASHRNYYTCVTSGMSDMPMSVPPGCEPLQYAELLICLPQNWPITREDFIASEDNYWPVRWLKELARYPYQADTWLGVDHSVPNGDPPEPLGQNTTMSGMLIGFPIFFDPGVFKLEVHDDKTIQFLQLFPVYESEMEYKLAHDAEKLWDRFFQKYGDRLEMLVDPNREPVA